MKIHIAGAIAPLLLVAPLLGACATIVDGSDQAISLVTNPAGATCTMTRKGKMLAQVSPTPGQVMVDKSKDDVQLHCEKAGYKHVDYVVESTFTGSTAGNILLGGVVGLAVDAASGANNQYPQSLTVNMTPVGQAETAPPVQATPVEKAADAKPTS